MQEVLSLTLANDLRELHRANALASAFLARRGVSAETVYATNLALEEIVSNVIKYGYEDRRRHAISVRLRTEGGSVDLEVVDDGRPFDPSSAPAVDVDSPLEERRVGGLGIHLLRSVARGIRYQRTDGRNHLHVRLGPDRSRRVLAGRTAAADDSPDAGKPRIRESARRV